MNLIQFLDSSSQIRVGKVIDNNTVAGLAYFGSIYQLARAAIDKESLIIDEVKAAVSNETFDYQHLVDENRLLAPIHSPDPARLLVSGTGLTHLGSADTRAAMHKKLHTDESELTDSMKMFRLGIEGGKPQRGDSGVQPEWFYKGDGSIVVNPGHPIQSPEFSLDIGDEAEIVGIYLIGNDSRPYRVGFALGNEFSDHQTEKINYLYLAHSKLRPCSFGPELLTGDLPRDINGTTRIVRNGNTAWEKEFLSGENNMSHSISNLEFHHFKYRQFLRPGDVHVHFFGTGTLSFGDGFKTREGDVFEIHCELFGRSLRNEYKKIKLPVSPETPVTAL